MMFSPQEFASLVRMFLRQVEEEIEEEERHHSSDGGQAPQTDGNLLSPEAIPRPRSDSSLSEGR